MAFIAYKKQDNSNVVIVKSSPVVGIIAITSFTESLTVGSGGTFIAKTFRYSIDGINYSDWQDLTTPNITALSFNEKDIVIFELSYVKDITDPSLDVTSISFSTTDSPTGYDETYFSKSVFNEYFDSSSLDLLRWYVNVLEKIYERGLIPNYLDRLDDFGSDQDFIDFWKSIAKFFGFYVIYARQFSNFEESESLLAEYLQQRGLAISKEDDITQLQYLMEKYYTQVLHRGTIHIIDDSSLGVETVDGELLRLIYYLPTDEFLFNLHKVENFGWNLGNSSPLWRGLFKNESLNKFNPNSPLEWIKIDPSLTYEISFWVQTADDISLIVKSRDIDSVPTQLKSYIDGSLTNEAFSSVKLFRSDKSLFVRVIIFSQTKVPFIDGTTNLHQGNNLIFTPYTTAILPLIYRSAYNIYGYYGEGLGIDNLDSIPTTVRVAPLFTNFSHGVIQVYNWISIWLKNNNQHYAKQEIKRYIRKYLVPYNSHVELVDIFSDVIEDGGAEEVLPPAPTPTLAWRGKGSSCSSTTTTEETTWIADDSEVTCEVSPGSYPYLYYGAGLGLDNLDNYLTYYWIGEESTAECITE